MFIERGKYSLTNFLKTLKKTFPRKIKITPSILLFENIILSLKKLKEGKYFKTNKDKLKDKDIVEEFF